MTAPTDADLDWIEEHAREGCSAGAGEPALVLELIAALREARATISDLEDELVAARQPTDDLEGALEIVKVDNEDLRAQLAAARADTRRLDWITSAWKHPSTARDTIDRWIATAPTRGGRPDAAMVPAPDARTVMAALGGEIVPTGEQQDAINRAFASESRAISERAP
jgi:hypothetical protein